VLGDQLEAAWSKVSVDWNPVGTSVAAVRLGVDEDQRNTILG
jgi:hypothetical protein